MKDKLSETLGRLSCQTCGGDKHFQYQGPYDVEIEDCPDCRDASDKPTGLAAWELTEECPQIKGYINGHLHRKRSDDCYLCHGTGRTLLQGDLLQCAGERVLAARVSVLRVGHDKVWDQWWYELIWVDQHNIVKNRFDTDHHVDRLAALLEALKVVMMEVRK